MDQAVAALLQSDPSAIVTLASSGLSRPKDLDGKVTKVDRGRTPDAVSTSRITAAASQLHTYGEALANSASRQIPCMAPHH